MKRFTLTALAVLALGLVSVRSVRADEVEDVCLDGILLLEDGKASEALAKFNKSLTLDPKYAAAYAYRARAYTELRQLPKALADCNAALKIDPKFARAYHHRGGVFLAAGRNREALMNYTQALKLSPKDAQTLNDRGVALLNVGNLNAALADFSAAIDADPKHADAHGNRGVARLAAAALTRSFGSGAARAFGTDPTADRVAALEAAAQADLERCYELKPELRAHFERLAAGLRNRARAGAAFQKRLNGLFGGLAD